MAHRAWLHRQRCRSGRQPRAAQTYYESVIESRADLPFEIDGMVIKVNSLALQQQLGFYPVSRAGRRPINFLLKPS